MTRTVAGAVLACALFVAGCCGLRIDPSGQRLFVDSETTRLEPGSAPAMGAGPLRGSPVRGSPGNSAVNIQPRTVIAPVGAEVILTAGVCGGDGYLIAGERVEWMLAQGGVGEFVTLGEADGLCDMARKVDNFYAIGSTSRRYLTLTRGTATTGDDVSVVRGQAWISVTSPREGVSLVTAFAPDVGAWGLRKDTATIHWTDAQWQFPPAATNPAGTSHTFTTLVTRRSSQTPLAGWIVRYQITGGPPAGFKPDGGQTLEVTTNALGQASVEIFQTTPTFGTNTVRVDILRPADSALGIPAPMLVGSGSTQKSWSAPQVSIRKTGPAQAAVGATLTYRIEVTNAGSVAANDVVVSDLVPAGITLLDSTPSAKPLPGGGLSWNLGTLAGGQTQTIVLNLRADRPGTINNCAKVRTAEGLSSESCVSTVVGAAVIELRIDGPQRAAVGGQVEFNLVITNRGLAPATGLVVRDEFDEGFVHESSASPIERSIDDLPPGATTTIGVTFRVAKAGQLCHSAEVTAAGATTATARACVTTVAVPPPVAPRPEPTVPPVVPRPVPADPPVTAPATPETPRGPPPKLSVKKTGPVTRNVGDLAEFEYVVTNEGQTTAKQVRISDQYDLEFFDPELATDGYTFDLDKESLVWNLDELPAGKTAAFQAQCRCLKASPNACSRVTVTAAGSGPVTSDVCVEIRGQAKINLQIDDLDDPISVGRTTRYVIQIVNEGEAPARQVVLQIALPPEFVFDAVGPTNPSRHRVTDGEIRFEPYAELGPREKLIYRLELRGTRAGTALLRATATGAGLTPVSTDATTTVLAR